MKHCDSARNYWLLAFWTALLAVLTLSLLPSPPDLPDTGWDKTNHFLAFAILYLLGHRAYAKPRHQFFGLMLYGGLIELLQSFTAYRYAEWEDIAADVAGLIVGLGIQAIISPPPRREKSL